MKLEILSLSYKVGIKKLFQKQTKTVKKKFMHIITNQQGQRLKKNYVVPKRNEKARKNCHIDQLIPLSKQILQKNIFAGTISEVLSRIT